MLGLFIYRAAETPGPGHPWEAAAPSGSGFSARLHLDEAQSWGYYSRTTLGVVKNPGQCLDTLEPLVIDIGLGVTNGGTYGPARGPGNTTLGTQQYGPRTGG